MPERSVTIRLNAVDNFSATLDAYAHKLGELDAATQRLNASSAGLGGMIGQVGAGDAAGLTPLPGGDRENPLANLNPLAGLLGGDDDESDGAGVDFSALVGGLNEMEAALERATTLSEELTTQLNAAGETVSADLKPELTAAAGVTDQIAEQFAQLTDSVQVIKVKIEVDDPRGVLPHLRSGGAFDLRQTVRDNGGTVPGADGRA